METMPNSGIADRRLSFYQTWRVISMGIWHSVVRVMSVPVSGRTQFQGHGYWLFSTEETELSHSHTGTYNGRKWHVLLQSLRIATVLPDPVILRPFVEQAAWKFIWTSFLFSIGNLPKAPRTYYGSNGYKDAAPHVKHFSPFSGANRTKRGEVIRDS